MKSSNLKIVKILNKRCPWCKKDVYIVKSRDMAGEKGFDLVCNTDGCFVNMSSWLFFGDVEKLVEAWERNGKPKIIRPKKKKSDYKYPDYVHPVHYGNKISMCGRSRYTKRHTTKKALVTCRRCLDLLKN